MTRRNMHQMFPPQDGKYVGYLRRSRQDAEYEQYGKFEILARHERTIRDMAQDYGHTLVKIYKEVVSGETIADRTEFKKLLREIVNKEWDGVYVVEASRLGRGSGSDQDKIVNAFEFSGVWLITDNKIYNPYEKSDMRQLRRELQKAYDERDDSVERLIRGKVRAATEGCYLPSQAPYGWQRVRINLKWTLEPHPVNYERMLQIYDMIDDGHSLNYISNQFEKLGYETSHGAKHWTASAIKQIAQNPVNIGYITWNRLRTEKAIDPETLETYKIRTPHDDYIIADGLHKKHCTLDREKFDRVQKKIEARSPYSMVYGKPLRNPLAGLLRCSNCKRTLKWSISTRMNPPIPIYTHNGRSKKHDGCKCKSIHVDELMEALIETLQSIKINKEFEISNDMALRRERMLREIESCEKAIEDAKQEKKRVMHGYRTGLYSDDEFVEQKAEVAEKITTLEERLLDLQSNVPSEEDIKHEVVTIDECIDILQSEATPQEINDALKIFIKSIEYTNYAPPRKQWNDVRLDIFFV